MLRPACLLAALLASACYGSHPPEGDTEPPPAPAPTPPPDPRCPDAPASCVRHEAGPCSRLIAEPPQCSDDGLWWCDGDGAPHLEVIPMTNCYAFSSVATWVWGGGLTIDDGADDASCSWLFQEARADGRTRELGAVGLSSTVLPRQCPSSGWFHGSGDDGSVFDRSALDPDAIIRPLDTASPDATWVSYELWMPDESGAFGVRPLGKGVARMSDGVVRMTSDLLWPEGDGTMTFGDSMVVVDDTVYVYGCRGPVDLLATECALARVAVDRLDDRDAYEVYAGDGTWTDDPAAAVTVVRSGVDTNVRQHPGMGRFVLTTVEGFGDHVAIQSAPAPEGPWMNEPVALTRALPAEDPDAFCTGAVQHPELMDPVYPNELVVSYAIGTMAQNADQLRSDAPWGYSLRVDRVSLP